MYTYNTPPLNNFLVMNVIMNIKLILLHLIKSDFRLSISSFILVLGWFRKYRKAKYFFCTNLFWWEMFSIFFIIIFLLSCVYIKNYIKHNLVLKIIITVINTAIVDCQRKIKIETFSKSFSARLDFTFN